MKNIAIILAAGIGKRVGNSLPEQFIELKGIPVILYALEAFQAQPAIDKIIVVAHAGYLCLT